MMYGRVHRPSGETVIKLFECLGCAVKHLAAEVNQAGGGGYIVYDSRDDVVAFDTHPCLPTAPILTARGARVAAMAAGCAQSS